MQWTRLKLIKHPNRILEVSLNRPDKLNALDFPTFQELDKLSRQLRKRRDLRAVLLSGQGDSFSAGLDIKSVTEKATTPARLLAKLLPGQANLAQRISANWRKLPFPVIAVIHGHCLGGGVQIVMGADYRIAAPTSTLSIMESKWGLMPDMAGLLGLRDNVAKDQVMRYTMTAELIDAETALQIGLVSELSEEPLQQALRLAEKISLRSPDAVAAVKLGLHRNWLASERSLLARETWYQLKLFFGKNRAIATKRELKKTEQQYQVQQRWR